MPLNKPALQASLAAALRENFTKDKEGEWEIDKAADEMAKAIADAVDAYVTGARVGGVQSQVRNPANVVIGTGSQTGQVALS